MTHSQEINSNQHINSQKYNHKHNINALLNMIKPHKNKKDNKIHNNINHSKDKFASQHSQLIHPNTLNKGRNDIISQGVKPSGIQVRNKQYHPEKEDQVNIENGLNNSAYGFDSFVMDKNSKNYQSHHNQNKLQHELKSGNKNQQQQRKSVLSVDRQDKDKADVQGYQAMATGDNKCTCDGIDDPCSELNKMNSQLFGTDKGRDKYKTDWMVDAIKRGTVSVATQFNRLAFLQHKKKSDPYQAEPLFPVESAEQHLAMKDNLSCCCDVFTKTLLVKGVGNTVANPNQQFDNGLGVGRVNTSLADMAAQTILHMNNLHDAKTSFQDQIADSSVSQCRDEPYKKYDQTKQAVRSLQGKALSSMGLSVSVMPYDMISSPRNIIVNPDKQVDRYFSLNEEKHEVERGSGEHKTEESGEEMNLLQIHKRFSDNNKYSQKFKLRHHQKRSFRKNRFRQDDTKPNSDKVKELPKDTPKASGEVAEIPVETPFVVFKKAIDPKVVAQAIGNQNGIEGPAVNCIRRAVEGHQPVVIKHADGSISIRNVVRNKDFEQMMSWNLINWHAIRQPSTAKHDVVLDVTRTNKLQPKQTHSQNKNVISDLNIDQPWTKNIEDKNWSQNAQEQSQGGKQWIQRGTENNQYNINSLCHKCCSKARFSQQQNLVDPSCKTCECL